MASACAAACAVTTLRIAARLARAEDRRLHEFGIALTQAARELTGLAASQSAAVAQAQAHGASAVAAAGKAANLVAAAETRLNRALQRAEQTINAASASLHTAQAGLAPFTDLALDLPGAIGTAVRDAAQTGMQDAASRLDHAANQLAAAEEANAMRLLAPPAPALPASALPASALIELAALESAITRIEDSGLALSRAASATAGQPELAAMAEEALAAIREERAALAADRHQNEHIASLLLRLGQHAAAAAQRAEAATHADVSNAAAGTPAVVGGVQNALRFMETALERAAAAAAAQDAANARVLQATQEIYATMAGGEKQASVLF